jgi:hypothetical protein
MQIITQGLAALSIFLLVISSFTIAAGQRVVVVLLFATAVVWIWFLGTFTRRARVYSVLVLAESSKYLNLVLHVDQCLGKDKQIQDPTRQASCCECVTRCLSGFLLWCLDNCCCCCAFLSSVFRPTREEVERQARERLDGKELFWPWPQEELATAANPLLLGGRAANAGSGAPAPPLPPAPGGAAAAAEAAAAQAEAAAGAARQRAEELATLLLWARDSARELAAAAAARDAGTARALAEVKDGVEELRRALAESARLRAYSPGPPEGERERLAAAALAQAERRERAASAAIEQAVHRERLASAAIAQASERERQAALAAAPGSGAGAAPGSGARAAAAEQPPGGAPPAPGTTAARGPLVAEALWQQLTGSASGAAQGRGGASPAARSASGAAPAAAAAAATAAAATAAARPRYVLSPLVAAAAPAPSGSAGGGTGSSGGGSPSA